MARSAKTQQRHPKGTTGSKGGQFAPKQGAVTPSSQPMFLGTLHSVQAEQKLRGVCGELNRALDRKNLTPQEVADVYVDANAMTSVLLKRRQECATKLSQENHGLKPGKYFTVTDTERNKRWKLKTGKERSRFDEESLREGFMEGTSTMTPDEVTARSRSTWIDSKWNAKALREAGVPLRDVCTTALDGYSVVPDEDSMAAATARYEGPVDDTISGRQDDQSKFFATASLHQDAAALKARAERTLKSATGWDESQKVSREIRGTRGAQGHIQNACELKPSYSHTQWDTDLIHRHLAERADGDGQRMARMINEARPRGGWRGGTPVDHSDPPNVSVSVA